MLAPRSVLNSVMRSKSRSRTRSGWLLDGLRSSGLLVDAQHDDDDDGAAGVLLLQQPVVAAGVGGVALELQHDEPLADFASLVLLHPDAGGAAVDGAQHELLAALGAAGFFELQHDEPLADFAASVLQPVALAAAGAFELQHDEPVVGFAASVALLGALELQHDEPFAGFAAAARLAQPCGAATTGALASVSTAFAFDEQQPLDAGAGAGVLSLPLLRLLLQHEVAGAASVNTGATTAAAACSLIAFLLEQQPDDGALALEAGSSIVSWTAVGSSSCASDPPLQHASLLLPFCAVSFLLEQQPDAFAFDAGGASEGGAAVSATTAPFTSSTGLGTSTSGKLDGERSFAAVSDAADDGDTGSDDDGVEAVVLSRTSSLALLSSLLVGGGVATVGVGTAPFVFLLLLFFRAIAIVGARSIDRGEAARVSGWSSCVLSARGKREE